MFIVTEYAALNAFYWNQIFALNSGIVFQGRISALVW